MVAGKRGPDRTRLEQVLRQRRRTVQEFCVEFHAAARELGESAVISHRQVSRWLGGQLGGLPHPATCRVLERMFSTSAEELLGPPRRIESGVVRPVLAGLRVQGDADVSIEDEVAAAAVESARFAQFAEQSNVGPHVLEQFRADVGRIVTTYPNRPVHPLFAELRVLRDRVFALLEGRQPPARSRELYLVGGVVCGVLANASFDLGWLAAAETQARTAFLCAEFAGCNSLRSWIRGTQSLIAYWDERPRDAVELAAQGWAYEPESGTPRVRLASIEARALARLGDRRATVDALGRADRARAEVRGEDDPGGLMTFPVAKQTFYSASAWLWLGDRANLHQAERAATEAVRLYDQEPSQHRRLGELSLARLDLAMARLGRDDLEGTAEQVRAVLEVAERRRTDSVVRRLRQLVQLLQRPHLRTTALALELREQVSACCDAPSRPELVAGAS
ncbi:hypothetical protein ACL03H_04200 [Saccharopolyspora sp. MS10]|uniref:hypothetical protein n=1 Tax=Saccharopolyspora sp. MS10 TaxID=3385973 RepID=UPI00399EF79D